MESKKVCGKRKQRRWKEILRKTEEAKRNPPRLTAEQAAEKLARKLEEGLEKLPPRVRLVKLKAINEALRKSAEEFDEGASQ